MGWVVKWVGIVWSQLMSAICQCEKRNRSPPINYSIRAVMLAVVLVL